MSVGVDLAAGAAVDVAVGVDLAASADVNVDEGFDFTDCSVFRFIVNFQLLAHSQTINTYDYYELSRNTELSNYKNWLTLF